MAIFTSLRVFTAAQDILALFPPPFKRTMDGPIRKLNRSSAVRSSGNGGAANSMGEGSSGTDTITRQHATSDPLSALLAGAGDDAPPSSSFAPSSSSSSAAAASATVTTATASSSSQHSIMRGQLGTPSTSRSAPAPNPRSAPTATPAPPTPTIGTSFSHTQQSSIARSLDFFSPGFYAPQQPQRAQATVLCPQLQVEPSSRRLHFLRSPRSSSSRSSTRSNNGASRCAGQGRLNNKVRGDHRRYRFGNGTQLTALSTISRRLYGFERGCASSGSDCSLGGRTVGKRAPQVASNRALGPCASRIGALVRSHRDGLRRGRRDRRRASHAFSWSPEHPREQRRRRRQLKLDSERQRWSRGLGGRRNDALPRDLRTPLRSTRRYARCRRRSLPRSALSRRVRRRRRRPVAAAFREVPNPISRTHGIHGTAGSTTAARGRSAVSRRHGGGGVWGVG